MLFPDSIPFKAVWAWTSFWWRLAFAARLGVAMVLWCFGLVYLLWCEGIKWYVNCVIIFYCNQSTILQGQYWWEYMFCQIVCFLISLSPFWSPRTSLSYLEARPRCDAAFVERFLQRDPRGVSPRGRLELCESQPLSAMATEVIHNKHLKRSPWTWTDTLGINMDSNQRYGYDMMGWWAWRVATCNYDNDLSSVRFVGA